MLSSCVRTVVENEEDENVRKYVGKSLVRKQYKKLKNYNLILYPIGNNNIITLDKEATLKLRLKNFARKTIRIDEWYMTTPNNVSLYYHPFDLRVKKFIPKDWTKVTPKIENEALRFRLELLPRNSVLITKKLDFLNDLKPPKGKTKRFLMVAELNLHSVKVRSKMFSIEVKQK
jgi:hypothetical protein